MLNQDVITFKALYAPFSHKKRKKFSDGTVSFAVAKLVVVLKDSNDEELARCKLTGSWRPQVCTVFKGCSVHISLCVCLCLRRTRTVSIVAANTSLCMCLQSGQTDVTIFEGYICEIYEDVISASPQESAQVLPTKKAPRGVLRTEAPRAAKLPLVRTANREHHTDASRSRSVVSNLLTHGTGPQLQHRRTGAHAAASPACPAQPLAHRARRTRSGVLSCPLYTRTMV